MTHLLLTTGAKSVDAPRRRNGIAIVVLFLRLLFDFDTLITQIRMIAEIYHGNVPGGI